MNDCGFLCLDARVINTGEKGLNDRDEPKNKSSRQRRNHHYVVMISYHSSVTKCERLL